MEEGKQPIQKIRYSHDAMIDLIIANPGISQGQLAAHFGYTQGWVSTVMSSDAWKARLAQRRAEIIDPALIAEVEERFEGIIRESQRIVMEKLNANPTADFALKSMEVASKALGYGAKQGLNIGEQHNYVVVMPEKAETADDWIAKHSPARIPQTIEVAAEKAA